MPYTLSEYQADRATMGYKSRTGLFVAGGLLEKRKRLERTLSAKELPAMQAAFDRLMAWLESGQGIPRDTPDGMETTPPEPPLEPQNAGAGESDKAWEAELDRQLERHINRRGSYPDVVPPRPN